MQSLYDEKRKLRKEFLARRNSLSEEEINSLSLMIKENLLQSDSIREAQKVHCYMSFSSEVRTLEIISSLLALGKQVYVPIIAGDTLLHAEIDTTTQYATDRYGIPTPFGTQTYSSDQLQFSTQDCIIIPMVCFDMRGARLGYGKGYYDKFLPETKGKKIGLAFECQGYELLPSENFDISMDIIVTERRKIEVGM